MSKQSLFETVLASTVHDMKNSLSLLLGQLDGISERLQQDDDNRQAVSDLRYQANRINVSLMELLTLYKLERKQIGVQINEVVIVDFLMDCIATHSPLAESKLIQLDLDCDDTLIWFLDPDLVGIALNNIIGNCMRYTHSRVEVSAKLDNRNLVIRVDDDGPGYPEHMLVQAGQPGQQINAQTGSTGLGLFFAATIAENHVRQGKQGQILLQNQGLLGGGVFQMTLP